MARLGDYEIHPVAAMFPLMEGESFTQLVADIKENGLNDPIILSADGSMMIDGRNRWRACEQASVDPAFKRLGKHYTELDILRFIISKNIKRRHMDAGQRGILAIALAPELEKAAKQRMCAGGGDQVSVKAKKNRTPGEPKSAHPVRDPQVRDQLAEMFGVGHTTMSQAKTVVETSPQIASEVANGTKSLNEAYKEVRKKPKSSEPKQSKKAAMLELKTHTGEIVLYKRPTGKPTFNQTNDQVSWAAWTWNPVTGCLHGCRYCYAREMAVRRSYREAYPVGFTPLFHSERLNAPANMVVPDKARDDLRLGRVFVCSMADLYGQWVPDEWIERVHASCIANPHWEYLMLTKFPRRYVGLQLPPTAWIGTSVDEQKRVRLAEEAFRNISGVRVKWLSLEPLLAPLQFTDMSMFDFVVIGSQSATEQPGLGYVEAFAPPFEWVARLTDQAREAGCKIYHKPNLLGITDDQHPGMKLIQEAPDIKPLKRAQGELKLVSNA